LLQTKDHKLQKRKTYQFAKMPNLRQAMFTVVWSKQEETGLWSKKANHFYQPGKSSQTTSDLA